MSILVIRHGERADAVPDATPANTDTPAAVADASDPPLTARGIAAAKQLALEAISRIVTSQSTTSVEIISSPFLRCAQTAVALSEGLMKSPGGLASVTLEFDNELAEVYGPQRIKTGKPACLDNGPSMAWEKVPELLVGSHKGGGSGCPADAGNDQPPSHTNTSPEAAVPSPLPASAAATAVLVHRKGELPRWGESISESFTPFQRCFKKYCGLAERKRLDSGIPSPALGSSSGVLTILVTHGDALQAIVAAMHASRTVYNCEFLGFILASQRRFVSPALKRAFRNQPPESIPPERFPPSKWCVVEMVGAEAIVEGTDDDVLSAEQSARIDAGVAAPAAVRIAQVSTSTKETSPAVVAAPLPNPLAPPPQPGHEHHHPDAVGPAAASTTPSPSPAKVTLAAEAHDTIRHVEREDHVRSHPRDPPVTQQHTNDGMALISITARADAPCVIDVTSRKWISKRFWHL